MVKITTAKKAKAITTKMTFCVVLRLETKPSCDLVLAIFERVFLAGDFRDFVISIL